MLLVRLSLSLALTSLATAAAIPSSPALQQFSASQDGDSLSSRDASWTPATQSASLNGNHKYLSKRTAYYFLETVPDEHEVADRITALREASLIASKHGHRPEPEPESKSLEIETPHTGIDTPHARTSPVRDWMAELDRLEATESVWEMMPSLLPPLRFFVIASSIIAVLTVIRGCLRARR